MENLAEVVTRRGILLENSNEPELAIRSIATSFHSNAIATAFGESSKRHCKSKILLWNASAFKPETKTAAVVPRYRHLADNIDFLIGANGQRLVVPA